MITELQDSEPYGNGDCSGVHLVAHNHLGKCFSYKHYKQEIDGRLSSSARLLLKSHCVRKVIDHRKTMACLELTFEEVGNLSHLILQCQGCQLK